MIGSQDDLLKFIMQIPKWYKLSKVPIPFRQAHQYKTRLYNGTMLQATKDKLCKNLGIKCVQKEYVVPSVWEYQRIKKPATEFQKYLGRLIFGYDLPKELKAYKDEIARREIIEEDGD